MGVTLSPLRSASWSAPAEKPAVSIPSAWRSLSVSAKASGLPKPSSPMAWYRSMPVDVRPPPRMTTSEYRNQSKKSCACSRWRSSAHKKVRGSSPYWRN